MRILAAIFFWSVLQYRIYFTRKALKVSFEQLLEKSILVKTEI